MARKFKRINKNTDLRPTSSKVKLALFNILYDIHDTKFLDLFAGTGAIGFEALKRGAKEVVFVEKNRKRASDIKKTVSKHFSNFKVYSEDSLRFLKNNKEKFDIIFADPPYNYKDYDKLIELSLKNLENNGIFILEHRFDKDFKGDRKEKYGDTVLTFFYK